MDNYPLWFDELWTSMKTTIHYIKNFSDEKYKFH